VRWPKIAAALLALAALDLIWGIGSYGSTTPLLPPLQSETPRFR
jgi:hypothetical protein